VTSRHKGISKDTNLLRGEDAGYRDSSYGITEKFDLSIIHLYRQIKACYMLF
jgi:hypothetical protein